MINIGNYRKGFKGNQEAGYYSQNGEDGVLECIYKELKIQSGWVVELGAWDGIKYSNVRRLVEQCWSGVLIEADANKFKELQRNTEPFKSRVFCHHGFVSLEKEESLNNILSRYPIPYNFDLLSLDIDGIDYWIWKDLKYQPKVVVVEYNSNWKDSITITYDRNHSWNGTQYFGASASALHKLGESKGYDLIGCTKPYNLIFLKKEFNKDLFEIIDINNHQLYIHSPHHHPISKEQEKLLVFNPPVETFDDNKIKHISSDMALRVQLNSELLLYCFQVARTKFGGLVSNESDLKELAITLFEQTCRDHNT